MNKQKQLEKLLLGCPTCAYEEADGVLYRHCNKCQFDISKLAYEIVIENKTTLGASGFRNGLTDAEEEMLQIAEEECAELIQAISKIRRHGIDREEVGQKGEEPLEEGPRIQNLHEECGDVIACIAILSHNKLIEIGRVNKVARQKLDRLKVPGNTRVHFMVPHMIP